MYRVIYKMALRIHIFNFYKSRMSQSSHIYICRMSAIEQSVQTRLIGIISSWAWETLGSQIQLGRHREDRCQQLSSAEGCGTWDKAAWCSVLRLEWKCLASLAGNSSPICTAVLAVAEREQIRLYEGGEFVLCERRILPCGCEYGENWIIISTFWYFCGCARTLYPLYI